MPATRTINFTLNGRPVTADVKPHHNVVEMLQTQFALTGARESCGQGLCGCCTVLLDGKPVSGCLTLAVFLDGSEVDHRRAPGRAAASLMRCSRPSSTAAPSSAAFARPALC